MNDRTFMRLMGTVRAGCSGSPGRPGRAGRRAHYEPLVARVCSRFCCIKLAQFVHLLFMGKRRPILS